jgi:hypothetical protein
MEAGLTEVLNAIARFEYLIAKREYEKLVSMMELEGQDGDRFRLSRLKPHEKLIVSMLHKCAEIDLAYEGVY